MNKWISLILCLMLVLPLHAYAEDTGIQPLEQTESQPPQQTESQPPEQPESQPPQQTESQPPEQPESQPPQQTESQPPEQPESQPPQQTESQPPEQTESQGTEHTHNWDVSYTVPATCLEEGAKAYGCSACGAVSVEVLPILTTHTYDNACDPHCNICDISREVPHKFSISTTWSKNSQGHWHTCSACGAQEDFGKHYPGPAATEEKAQICLTCGYTLTAKRSHSHKYDTQWKSDDSGHWYPCRSCEDRKDFKPHSYDNSCDPDCNVCGYTVTTAHIYSGTWLTNESSHWDICTICQKQSIPEPHIPSPDASKTEAQICLTCGFELVPAQTHIHEAVDTWLADDLQHWKLCSCKEVMEQQPHNWDEGTDQEDTTVLYTCQECGITRTEGELKTQIRSMAWIWVCAIIILILATLLLGLMIFKLRKPSKYGR